MKTVPAASAFLLALGFLLAGAAAHNNPASASAKNVHVTIGRNMLLKVYVINTNSTEFENITVWLENTPPAPAEIAKFANESGISGISFSSDMRYAEIGMNPMEEKTLTVVIQGGGVQSGGDYAFKVKSNTTDSWHPGDHQDSVNVALDFAPNFPGLDWWGFLAITGISGLAFWRIQK